MVLNYMGENGINVSGIPECPGVFSATDINMLAPVLL